MEWELTEVPGNLTTSIQDSTVDVVAARIESKVANTLIRQLSHICPLENLRHVKRVHRRTECGKSELSIILCLSTGYETCSKQLPDDVQKIVDTHQLNPFTAKSFTGFQVSCYIKRGMGRAVQTLANFLPSCARVCPNSYTS